jgi:hypothetical protein
MYFSLGLLIGFALLIGNLAPCQAQTAQPSSSSSSAAASTSQSRGASPSSDASAGSLERIREGVMRSERITLPDFGVPTFQIEVAQDTIKMQDQWRKTNAVGDYVRSPYFSNYHQDFLTASSVTGRPPVANGFGIPVGALISGLKKGFRDREASRIRAQIQQELDEIDPTRSNKPAQAGAPASPPD